MVATTRKESSKKGITKKKVVRKSPLKKKNSSQTMSEILRDTALKVLDDRKAEDIVLIDLSSGSALTDTMIVASGGSARQLGALSAYLRDAFSKLGHKGIRIEGLPQGDWVLVDAGDVIIHLFRPEVRSYYKIEEIWNKKESV